MPRARLIVLGTAEGPLMMMSEAVALPAEYWSPIETETNARSSATRLPDDLGERASALRASRAELPPGWSPVVLDVEADSDYLLGAVDVGAGSVLPGRVAPLVSWILEGAQMHSRSWHVVRELREMCDARPKSDEHAVRLAWETRTCATLLLGAIRDDVGGTAWLDLGAAIIPRIPQSREVRRRIAETAELEGTTYENAIRKLAAGGAIAAAADLRAGDKFRVDARSIEVNVMRLREVARAFRARAVRSVLATVGYDRRQRSEPSMPEPVDPLESLEVMAPEALRAVATPMEGRVLDALEEAAGAGYEGAEAREVAARELGMAPATLRVHLHNLRKKKTA